MTAARLRRGEVDLQLGHIVDALIEQLPSGVLAREHLTQLVVELGLGPTGARQLREYIDRHHDGLTSGRSDGPAPRLRLLDRLAEVLPMEVERARCVRCAKTGRLNRRMDGQRGCGACYSREHVQQCVRCGKHGRPIWRENGGSVCADCANRDQSRWEACSSCGKTARVVARSAGLPLCQTCAPKPRYTCTSCRRPEQPAHAMTDAGPICGACYHRQKVAQCIQCEQVSPYVRKRPDTGTFLCFACWQPPVITCVRCGLDKPIKRSRGGTPVCDGCRSKSRSRRTCIECGQSRPVHSRLVMGSVCGPCYTRLRNHPAPCTTCHELRPLIGRDERNERICGPCAGEQRNWTCQTCGQFAALYADGECPTCVARKRVHELLSDRKGDIHEQLRPLVTLLDIDGNPRSVISWLHGAKWAEQLGDLARGHKVITHQILDGLPQTRSLNYLRQVLVHIGALNARDEEIDGTLPWLDRLLDEQPSSISTIVRPYATWSVLHRARRRKIRDNRSARKHARTRILLATDFLNWLAARGLTLGTASQSDVETWLANGSVGRHRLRDFLLWTRAHGLSAALDIPWLGREEPEDFMTQQDRWGLLRRCVHDTTVAPQLRAVGGLILLFGLTPTRIMQIRTADIKPSNGRIYLALGRRPMIVPGSLGDLLAQLAAEAPRHRHPIVGPTGQPNQWLFPGSTPGSHARSSWISDQLNSQLGLQVRQARNTALCTLAGDLPAPVLAELLDMHVTTAVRWTKLVKRDWTEYLGERAGTQRIEETERPAQK